MRAVADMARDAGDGLLRVSMDQNLVLGFIAAREVKGASMRGSGRSALTRPAPTRSSDVTTCPGAYSCNLALTKAMNLGEAARAMKLTNYADPAVRRLSDEHQRLPEFLRPALDRRSRLLWKRAQNRRARSSLLSDAARRRLRRERDDPFRPGRCRAFRARLAPLAVEARARSFS